MTLQLIAHSAFEILFFLSIPACAITLLGAMITIDEKMPEDTLKHARVSVLYFIMAVVLGVLLTNGVL